MQHTLVAVFDNRSDAQNALDELLASGFSRSDVNLSTVDPSGQTDTLSGTSATVDGTHEEGIGASIKHFFTGLFGSDSDEHAMKYSNAVTSGRHVVTVTTQSEPEVERAADVIERFGPIDIDERHDLTAEQAMSGAGATGLSSGASSGMYAGAAGSGMAMGQSMQSASMGSGSGTLNTAPGALQSSASEDRSYFATQNINDPVPKDTTFQEPLGANMQSGGSLDSAVGGNTLSGTQTSSNNPAVSTQQGLSGSSQNGGLTAGGTTVQGTASLPGSDDASLGGTIQSGNLSGGSSQNYQRDTSLSGTTMGGSLSGSQQRDTSTAIPVVQEELKVGKREVQRGGVRVFSRIVETPVDESVSLREEHVNVERRPVDQPLSTTDSAAFKEQSIELREMAEEAVVQKSARVVEEVRVGKEVSNREERIHDTVRHTDVQIESLGAQDTSLSGDDTFFRSDWNKNYSSLGGSYDDYAPAYRYGNESRSKYAGRNWDDVESDLRSDWDTKYAGSGTASSWEKFKAAVRHGWDKITPDMDDSDSHYRNHWSSTYGTSGDTYNDYEPAYKYGNEMRSSDKYRGRDWNDVESDLHSDWDTRYGKGGVSTWDKMKAAVRHGWDRVTS